MFCFRSPEQSSRTQVDRLTSFQRCLEGNRTILGEVLLIHTRVCLVLCHADRETVRREQKNLQEEWRTLERTVEGSLHLTTVFSDHSSALLSDLTRLQGRLETIRKDLQAKDSSAAQGSYREAQRLMEVNAEVRALQQEHRHLRQLSEELLLSCRWEDDSEKMHRGLQEVREELSRIEELLCSQTKTSSNTVMEKIFTVMKDALVTAKQMEKDIEGKRRRVPLLPEEVHQQLRDLKKLQSDILAKQGQLSSLVEEVPELLPQLDQAQEVPVIHASLECLEELSKSTTEKLAKAIKDVESGLQTREKLSEQIADLDSWILAHLQPEVSGHADGELLSPAELDRRGRRVQDTLSEAERQAAVCEALLMKTKDLRSELSISETSQLFDRIRNLQEDVQAISSREKTKKEELDEVTKTTDSRRRTLLAVEQSLRQILVELSRHRFPITRRSLQALRPLKHQILEHKSQVDLLTPWIPQEKTNEIRSVISDLQNKIRTLEIKAGDHESFLNLRQAAENLMENVREQVLQTKNEARDLEDRHKLCQSLLVQLPLVSSFCRRAGSRLQRISADLFPSQLTAEQQRLKQTEDGLRTLEMTLLNNLRLVERDALKDLDLESERKAAQLFLSRTLEELQKIRLMDPNQTAVDGEYQKLASVKVNVESKLRALELLEQKKGSKQTSEHLLALKTAVLTECDSQMVRTYLLASLWD